MIVQNAYYVKEIDTVLLKDNIISVECDDNRIYGNIKDVGILVSIVNDNVLTLDTTPFEKYGRFMTLYFDQIISIEVIANNIQEYLERKGKVNE